MTEKLNFITQENKTYTHLQCLTAACEAGIKWVQLRIKDRTENEIFEQAIQAREICNKYGVKLCINDYAAIARKVNADGVHLGKGDLPVNEARKLVGTKVIIGATANTFEDIADHAGKGADYIGLGPFRFTSTKKNLSPILGIEGYIDIMNSCVKLGINVPIIAIGGIEICDIPALMEARVYGIAVSGLLANSENIGIDIKKINELLIKS